MERPEQGRDQSNGAIRVMERPEEWRPEEWRPEQWSDQSNGATTIRAMERPEQWRGPVRLDEVFA